MPRDGSGVYHRPVGTDAVTDTSIESTKYNTNVADVEQDLNTPRPVVAGGTAGANATAALLNLGAEFAKQVVTNYNSMTFQPGSFYSASTATGAPVGGHAFSGICYQTDASNMFLEARDQDDSVQPGHVWVRQMKAGVWSSWLNRDYDATTYVNRAGDTMTGLLTLSGDPSTALQAATKQYADGKVSDTGDTMTGPLVLPGNPTLALQAAPKQYVDSAVSGSAVRYDTAQGLTGGQQTQAQSNIGVTAIGTSAVGQIVGTTGTVQPTAGKIGERLTGVLAGSFSGSGVPQPMGNVALSAGVWDLEVILVSQGAGAASSSDIQVALAAANNTMTPIAGSTLMHWRGASTPDAMQSFAHPRVRVVVNTTATYYVNMQWTGSGGTYGGNGLLTATRVS